VVNPGSESTATLSKKARAFEAAADTMLAVDVGVAIARGDKSAWVSDSKARGGEMGEIYVAWQRYCRERENDVA